MSLAPELLIEMHRRMWRIRAFDECAVTLEVRDDGVGLGPEADGGRGLGHIRQRVQDLGGSLTVESAPGQGTLVRAMVPTEEER